MKKDTQLLCTFTKVNKFLETIDTIKQHYTIAFEKIYVLQNRDNSRELMCTYNIMLDGSQGSLLDNTISIHRRKQTNTLYTINAINEIVMLLNNGHMNPNFPINWEDYKNNLLVTDEDGLKIIPTKIFDIVDVD